MWGLQTQQLGGRGRAPIPEASGPLDWGPPPSTGHWAHRPTGAAVRRVWGPWAAWRWGRGVEWVATLSPRSVEVTWGFRLYIPAVARALQTCRFIHDAASVRPSWARFFHARWRFHEKRV